MTRTRQRILELPPFLSGAILRQVVIQLGEVLRGKYRLESSIGKGGMGEVFCAVDLASQRRVAVKVVRSAFIGDLLMARLQREAIAAVRVRSDYVPQVIDVDTTEEGELFLVMELLRGQTLAERLRQRGHLTWDEVAKIGEDVLRGLMDAHAAGVIHRDLKPSNIFLELATPGGRERAKVLDFGVCKLDAPDGEKLTTTGESVGTVAYMAPEQIRGASKVDERADLYSFATVIFEAICGRMAHDASGQMAMLASKLEKPALRIGECAMSNTPVGLDALITGALSRNPADRIGSAAELLAEWRGLGAATLEPHTLPIIDLTAEASSLPPGTHGTQTNLTAGTGTMTGHGSRSRVPLVLAVGAVAMSIGVLIAMLNVRSAPATSGAAGENTPFETPVTVAPAVAPETHGALVAPAPAAAVDVAASSAASPTAGSTAGRPPRRYSRPASKPLLGPKHPSEPHIVDKPRY